MSSATLAERIDALLPQTQCTKCGYAGCRPYADAIAGGQAGINQCPPGGAAGIAKLAALLNRLPVPLNPANGIEQPLRVAVINESLCIGCTLCIQVCPVDAIVGSAKRMHSVVPLLCTGCDLCVPPCPVDCIEMLVAQPRREWTAQDAQASRERFVARNLRLAAEKPEQPKSSSATRTNAVQAAIERARARRAQAAR